MLRWFVALCAALFTLAAQAATYSYQGGPAIYVSNSTTCAPPHDCGTYTMGEQAVTGTFTTATPLAPNLVDANIVPILTSYSFSGRLFVIDSASPASRVNRFRMSTDASGAIVSASIELHRWTYSAAGSPPEGPHVGGDRRNQITVSTNGASGAYLNLFCISAGIGTSADGTADTCMASGGDDLGSSALTDVSAGNPWRMVINPVPTLGEWPLALLGLLAGALGLRPLRRR